MGARSARACRVQRPPDPSAKARPGAVAAQAAARPVRFHHFLEYVGSPTRQRRPVGAMVSGLLLRSFVKLRGEVFQIVVVYRHWRAFSLRQIEAANRHISTGGRWPRLEFATPARGNCCVWWCPEEDSNLHTLAGART